MKCKKAPPTDALYLERDGTRRGESVPAALAAAWWTMASPRFLFLQAGRRRAPKSVRRSWRSPGGDQRQLRPPPGAIMAQVGNPDVGRFV